MISNPTAALASHSLPAEALNPRFPGGFIYYYSVISFPWSFGTYFHNGSVYGPSGFQILKTGNAGLRLAHGQDQEQALTPRGTTGAWRDTGLRELVVLGLGCRGIFRFRVCRGIFRFRVWGFQT